MARSFKKCVILSNRPAVSSRGNVVLLAVLDLEKIRRVYVITSVFVYSVGGRVHFNSLEITICHSLLEARIKKKKKINNLINNMIKNMATLMF